MGQRNDRLLEDELHGVLRLGYGKSEARPGGTMAKLILKDWIRESVVARDQCYDTMGDPERMGYRYIYDNTELLNQRLTQAGVRLATALNTAYAAR